MEKKIIFAIILVAILACTSIVVASYVMTSDPANTVVSQQADLLLSAPLTAVQYENITLVSTCTDASYVGVITFFDGATPIGSNSSIAGVARLTYNVTQVKTYVFTAQGSHA